MRSREKEVQLKAHQCCGKKLSVRKVKTEEPMYFKKRLLYLVVHVSFSFVVVIALVVLS